MTASPAGSPAGPAVRRALALLAAVAVLLLWRQTLTLLFLSLLFAHVLRPAVDLLARRMPRGLAAGVALVAFLLVAAGAAAWFVPLLAAQGAEFVRTLPDTVAQGLAQLRSLRAVLLDRIPADWITALQDQFQQLMGQAGGFLAGRLVWALGTLRQLLVLLIVPVLAFYLVKDGHEIAQWLLRWAPERQRASWERHVASADGALAAYVRGQGMVCLVQAAMLTLVLAVIGFPYAFVLGPLAAVAELVPFLGATVLDVLLVLVGLSRGGLLWAWGLGSYVVINQVSAYLVTPRLMGRWIRVHPMALLVALAAGAEVAGLFGVLFALPLTAVGAAVIRTWREDRTAAAAAASASATPGGVAPSAAGKASPAA